MNTGEDGLIGMKGHGGDNVITEAFESMKAFLQSYGWYIVFILIGAYFFRPYAQQIRTEISIRQANNPTRVKILDEQRKRARLRQQMDMLKAREEGGNKEDADLNDATVEQEQQSNLKKRKNLDKKPKKVTRAPEPSRSSDYNPLIGDRGSSGFRPSTNSRYGGRRRRGG